MSEMTFKAEIENLDKAIDFIMEELTKMGASEAVKLQVHLAVEEIYVNVASYAYQPGQGPVTIRTQPEGDRIRITFIDQGVPYDPVQKDDPDVTLEIEERQIGGLGIFLAKQYMDEMSYVYENGSNILDMVKTIR